MKKIKQGHTKWKVVVYDPGKIEGYEDRHVACVYTCFATKVAGKSIYYSTESGPYICHKNFWKSKLFNTRRAAFRYAQQQIDKIDEGKQ